MTLTVIGWDGTTVTLHETEIGDLPSYRAYGGYRNQLGNVRGLGNYTGVPFITLCDLAGGILLGDTVRITASDGFAKSFTYSEVYGNFVTYDPNNGTILVPHSQPLVPILAYYYNDQPITDGPLRSAIVGPEGLATGSTYWVKYVVKMEIKRTKPYVDFKWSPTEILPGDVVTFDATASFDPDGGSVTDCAWDFGDGSTVEHGFVVTHVFPAYNYAPYKVNCTITDDEGEQSYAVKDLRIWRDLGVVTMWLTMTETNTTDFDAYQTQMNPYSDLPGLSIIVSVKNSGTITETFDTGLSIDGYDYHGHFHHYDVDGSPMTLTLTPNATSGWNLWFMWDISYDSDVVPGQYTITATITDPFDLDSSNNVYSEPFGVHGSVEGIAFGGFQWGWHHGPVTFYGIMINSDNTTGVFRDPIDVQGEYARIQFEIVDRATGLTVATVYSQTKYLNYQQWAFVSATATLPRGKYICNWMVQFGTDGSSFPYWGQYMRSFKFTVR
jgi:hypothetical protein